MMLPLGRWALGVAEAVALGSEDPYCQVGAVVLSERRLVVGTGYNGPPSGVELDWSDREDRRLFVIHAEANALRLARPADTINGSLAVTHFPCGPCVNLAAAYGIQQIYWRNPPDWNTYPREPIDRIAHTAGIRLIQA